MKITAIENISAPVIEQKESNYSYTEEQLQLAVNGVYNRIFKRLFDLVLASIFFIILIPFYIIITIAVILDSGLPVLYRAPRGGYKDKSFRICKFRSMVQNADMIGGYTTALNDSRITRVGDFIRKIKLDETPQLINIIKGEMSFVGPRPEVLAYVNEFKGQEKYILQVRPGITDYSSIKFINQEEIVGTENVDRIFREMILSQKNALRLKYVAEISLKTDVKIFFVTVYNVFKKALNKSR